MDRFLRRLGIDDQTPLPDCKKNEQLMKRLEKDGYIYRVKESSGTGEDDVYWLVGPRGKVEIGDDGVRGLALAVHGDLPDEENDELERKIARSLGLAEKPSRAKRGEGNERGMQQAGEEDEEEEAEEEG
jgi:DNA-binding PadR family transcriptional regulator